MGKRPGGYKAWLVRWEWAGKHAEVEQPIVAIMRPQLGPELVRRFVEQHYLATSFEPDEMLRYMLHPKENPYPARYGTVPVIQEDGTTTQVRWDGLIYCGHNPFLVANIVTNLRHSTEADNSPLPIVWTTSPPPTLDLREFSKRKPTSES